MENFMLGVYIGLTILIIVGVIFGGIGLVYLLARHNIFWTIVKEGTAKAILKFGKVKKIVMVYQGYILDPAKGDIRRIEEGKGEQARKTGLAWIGIPFIYSVYRYEFRWTSFEQAEEQGKLIQKTIAHKEPIDFILVQDDVYYTFIREAETKDMVPVDVDLLLTIRIINPYKAFFRVQNWLEATQNQLKPVLRSYIASNDFFKLITRREGMGREMEALLTQPAEAEDADKGEALGSYLDDRYGVRIKKIGLVRIDPAGERGKTYQEAASQKWESERDKDRILTIADAEVERIERVFRKISDFGEKGLFLRAVEGIENAGKGPSNLVVFPLGALKDVMKGWIGKGGR